MSDYWYNVLEAISNMDMDDLNSRFFGVVLTDLEYRISHGPITDFPSSHLNLLNILIEILVCAHMDEHGYKEELLNLSKRMATDLLFLDK